MLGGGFMGQAHQTNKQNREMLKKHKKEQKQFLSGIDRLESNNSEEDSNGLSEEQRSQILKELEAKKRKHKIITTIVRVVIFGSMAIAAVMIVLGRIAASRWH
jgi:hypothetical protein